MELCACDDNRDELFQLMKEQMNTEQEQIFMASHYLYLQHGTDNTKFVVDFDNVWKNVDFTRRDNAKRILTNNFTENENYKISQLAPPKRGARCADTVWGLITVRCFIVKRE